MSILNKGLIKRIIAHAEKEYPKESCGLIIKEDKVKKYIPCRNIADKQDDNFIIDPQDSTDAEDRGKIVAVVHSHPDHTTHPSLEDRARCTTSEIPWVICSYPEQDVRIIVPEEAPLIGREFCHGTDWDCYGLVRDYYKRELGIDLNRYSHDSFWWDEDKSLYEDNFQKEGFYKVTDLKKHDLIFMKIRSPVVNHAGIYLGDGKVLQHCFGKLSKVDIYGGYWQEKTVFYARHKEVKDE